METLKQFVENQKSLLNDKVISLDNLTVVKKNKNGTVNCATKINGKNVVINYIDPKLIDSDHIIVRYGKKNPDWQQDYWYQIDPEEEA